MSQQNLFQRSTIFILQFTVSILAILTLLFFLLQISGDPAVTLAGHSASMEVIEAIREDLGLNEPVHVQYIAFMGRAVQLDFGESLRYQRPAFDVVLARFPNTLLLSFSALALAVLIGVPLGVYAAIFHHRADGMAINSLASILQSLPSFWLGLILLLIFAVNLHWFNTVAHLEENMFKRLFLPTLTLSSFYIARLIRLVRSGLIEEMSQYYVLTARAKGLTSRRVFFVHVFRNAMIPVVAFITLDLSFLIGGSVVVETLFSYSGVGDQLVQSIMARDYAVVQATVFLIAVIVVLINSLSNLMYQAVDPRIALKDIQ